MHKVEVNEAALAVSPFQRNETGTQDMVLYYRTTSGGIVRKTLSYKSLTEDVTITSVSKLSTNDETLSTMAAAEMPGQQYVVFFGDAESLLQTWWNATTWFGRKSPAPVYILYFILFRLASFIHNSILSAFFSYQFTALSWSLRESNVYWSRNITLTACAHPRKFEYHALYADTHGGSITEIHQTGNVLDSSQVEPTYKNLTGLQLVDEGRGTLAVSCFDDSLVLVYWSQGKLVYGIKVNGTWTGPMLL